VEDDGERCLGLEEGGDEWRGWTGDTQGLVEMGEWMRMERRDQGV
jgi:hypothetical protein